jgi:lysyl-tRNA synthetase, class I
VADTPDSDWVARFADEVIAAADRCRPGKPIVCASGLSPSGPVHLGNLREVLTPHLVADEIRRRGVPCEHIISWDDYDRFRRVPAAVDSSWSEHVGKPLSQVPAPPGSEHANWADHFRAPRWVTGQMPAEQRTRGIARLMRIPAMPGEVVK